MERIWPWLAAILSGILLTLCFPPFNQGWLCWIALAPLIGAVWFSRAATAGRQSAHPQAARVLERAALAGGPPSPALAGEPIFAHTAGHQNSSESGATEPRRRNFFHTLRPALLGYVTGLCFFWGVFYWLTTVTALGWFILAFYLALFIAVWSAFLSGIVRIAGDFTRSGRNLVAATLAAAAWVGLEWTRGWLFTGFGWDGIGVALHRNLPMIQIAEFTGVGGLSFLVVFSNLIAVLTIRRFVAEARRGKVRPHWDFSVNMAMVAAVFAFGIRCLYQPSAPSIPLTVAAVQANVPETERDDLQQEDRVLDRYKLLTETALALHPQLLLWPEAATPRPLFGDETTFRFVTHFAANSDVNLLIGTVDFDEQGHDFNIAALINNHSESIQTYRKIHLVPFGEYIPFRNSFPFFAWVVGNLVPSDFTPGAKHTILTLNHPDIKAGALICFEDTLGDLTRRFVQKGAQLLINITNDGWFLKSAGSAQHLANAVFRTVENRRPLVRAGNTGVTAFINPKGQIVDRLAPFVEGVRSNVVQVPKSPTPITFYTRHGDLFSEVCTALALLAIVPVLRQRPR